MMKQSKGLTLITLIITIILLLLLAGISIQALTNTGLFGSANNAKLQTKRGQISEYLGLELIDTQAEKYLDNSETVIRAMHEKIARDEGINRIKNSADNVKEVTVDEVKNEENMEEVDWYFYVIVDNDVFKVDLSGVKFIGELDQFPPIIRLESISNTTNSITVKVRTSRNQGGKLEYYIKGENDSDYKLDGTSEDSTYTYSGLEQNKKYSVKIVAVAQNKKTAEVTGERTTGSVPNLAQGDIKFTYIVDGKEINKETWTNKNVTVTASTTVTGYTLRTSKDGKIWSNAANQTFKENGQIYAALYDGTNYGGAASGNVTNIDTLEPKAFTPTATSTTKSITVTAVAEDADSTTTNGKSGISGYRFKLDSGDWTEYQTSGTYTWNNLAQTTNHTITVEAKDNAGNTKTGTVTKGTGTVTTLTTANTKFTFNPSGWTKGSVTATASTTATGYTLQTSKDGTTWTSTATQTFTANGKVYARLWDGTNGGTATSGNVTNIDTLPPNAFMPTATSTTKSITVTASATDADATTTNGKSGISGYRFKLDSGSWTEYQTSGTYTWNNLAQTINHTITVEAKDNAGNTKTGTVTKGTGTVTTLTTANTKFTFNPSGWTKGSVTATASTTATGYTLQTSKDGTTWSSTNTQTFTANGKVYARLWDGTNGGTATSGNVTNIDTLPPNTFTPTATSTTKSITVTASATDAEATTTNGKSGISGYRFKLDSGSWTEYQTSGTYTWNNLAQTTNHTITVEAKDNAGNTKTGTVTKSTGTVTSGTTSGAITFSTVTWSGGKASTTISTNTSYTIQYQVNSTTGTWTTGTSVTGRVHGDKVYARLWDGTNGGTAATLNISDGTKPSASINLSGTSTTTAASVTATVTHSDSQSGVKIASCKWVYNTKSSAIGINASSYTGGTFSSNGQKITLSASTAGTYYLHVLTTDVAGNVKETISSAITVKTPYPTMASKVSVGDYVAYDATNNYSYTSPTGTGMSHGNGSSDQKITSSSDIKWRVLSIDTSTEEVVLISEWPTPGIRMNGAMAYLYAEQELNNICSIYGHGMGANTSKTFNYVTGDLIEGTTKGTITGSGARCLNVDDINAITGYKPAKGNSYSRNVRYPTTKTITGYSTGAAYRTELDTCYDYYGWNYLTSSDEQYKLLFRRPDDIDYMMKYWLASRAEHPGPEASNWGVWTVNDGRVIWNLMFTATVTNVSGESLSIAARPIVYLKPTVHTNGKDSNGAWIIVDD